MALSNLPEDNDFVIKLQNSNVRFLAPNTCVSENNVHHCITQMKNRTLPVAVLALSLSTFCAHLRAVESVVQDMENAANAFLDSLTKELKARATFPMEVEGERTRNVQSLPFLLHV